MVADVLRISVSLVLVAHIDEFAPRMGRYLRLGLTSPARRASGVAWSVP